METKKIPNHNYSISTDGTVINTRTNKTLKGDKSTGYARVTLQDNKKKKRFQIHRLVAKLFISNPDNLPIINHKDMNKLNNSVENLEWCSYSHNSQHSIDNGKTNKGRSVLQFDKNNVLLNEYNSIKEAALATNGSADSIQVNCSGRTKSSGGFIWKYKQNKYSLEPKGKIYKDYINYIITKTGKIYSKKFKRILSPRLNTGYERVTLSKNSKKKDFIVHRLVAGVFIPNPDNLPIVNHKDNIRSNNNVENLEWCTASYNSIHAVACGAIKTRKVICINIITKEEYSFNSCTEASKFLNAGSGWITKACKKGVKVRGFKCKYNDL